jgi:hypothetical protein
VDHLARWSRRLAVLATTLMATVLLPAAAWASTNPTALAVGEVVAARRRARGGSGILGLLGGICCLVILALIALPIFLVMRRRRNRPPQPPQYPR